MMPRKRDQGEGLEGGGVVGERRRERDCGEKEEEEEEEEGLFKADTVNEEEEEEEEEDIIEGIIGNQRSRSQKRAPERRVREGGFGITSRSRHPSLGRAQDPPL